MEKTEGFYWVKYNGNWIVAQCMIDTVGNNMWYISGSAETMGFYSFEEIGSRIIKDRGYFN